MKKSLYILILLCFAQILQAQNTSEYRIMRSNLGSSGSSQTVTTTNGTYKISQSIGQASVIGTHSNNGYVLRQGYQQPETRMKVKIKDADYNLNTKVYPNPFSQKLTITFSTLPEKDILVVVYDVGGKVIYNKDFLPKQDLGIQLQNIESGIYFLKVQSGNEYFNTKLIKI